jgi:hypothetical protein
MGRTVLAIALAATAVAGLVVIDTAMFALGQLDASLLLITLAVLAMATVGAVLAVRVRSACRRRCVITALHRSARRTDTSAFASCLRSATSLSWAARHTVSGTWLA